MNSEVIDILTKLLQTTAEVAIAEVTTLGAIYLIVAIALNVLFVFGVKLIIHAWSKAPELGFDRDMVVLLGGPLLLILEVISLIVFVIGLSWYFAPTIHLINLITP